MNIQQIPLSQLQPSPFNVRRHDGGVEDLAASIKAHGLRQNLNVERKALTDDVYQVVAGGRRLRALRLLQERGELPKELLHVPCMVLEHGDTDSAEVSLAENVVRHAMHPADEFVAYNELATRAENPLTEVQIATRYGVPVKHVRQRLKLARVAPFLIELYRKGEAELEQLEAMALTDDQALQEKVWKGARGHWERQPHMIRRVLTEKEIDADSDPLVRFVGLDEYKAAGGSVKEDLFADEGEGLYITDPKLLRSLAEAKLNKRADQLLRDGWSWTEVRLDFGWEAKRKFTELDQKWGAGGKKVPWTDEQKAVSGCIVTVNGTGSATETHYGLQRPEDKKKAAEVARAAKKSPEAKAAAMAQEATPKPKKVNDELPMASVLRLQAHRTTVIRTHLWDNHRVAVAALAASLWNDGFSDVNANTPDGAVCIGPHASYSHRPDRVVDEVLTDHEEKFGLPRREALEKRIKLSEGESLFAWLLKQPIELSLEILAQVTAENLLVAQRADQRGKTDEGRRVAAIIGVDLSKHWKVTPEWLAEQPTAYVLKVVTGVCGKRAALEVAKAKGKANIAAMACEKILAADPTWLPDPLLPPKPKAPKKAAKA